MAEVTVDMVPRGGQRFCGALQGLDLWLVWEAPPSAPAQVGEAVTDGAVSVVKGSVMGIEQA